MITIIGKQHNKTLRKISLVTHIGLLLIIGGVCLGFFKGYSYKIVLDEGETINANSLNNSLDFSITCKKSTVIYNEYKNKKIPKQYLSNLLINTNSSKKITPLNYTISINNPLSYHSVDIHQLGYGESFRFKFKIDSTILNIQQQPILLETTADKEVTIHGLNIKILPLKPNLSSKNSPPYFLTQITFNKDNPIIEMLKTQMPISYTNRFNSNKISITLLKVIEKRYALLQISKNPGIPFIWSGFTMLILGLFLKLFLKGEKEDLHSN